MAEEATIIEDRVTINPNKITTKDLPDEVAIKEPAAAFKLDRKLMIIIGVGLIALVYTLVYFVLNPKFNLLFSNLSQSDAAAIGSYLEKKQIKFQISPDGENVLVAGTSIPKLRLELASKGLPKGSGVGFEIFDKTSINISDFNQKINYRRALEGELARTISSLESIKSAKVHLAIAEKRLFDNEQEETKASVILTTQFGASLKEDQIKGIQHLVSSAVNDLSPNNVQITDQDGNALVKFMDENSLAQEKLNGNEKKSRDFEVKIEKDLLTLLEPILGKGNVLVNVSAEMNFDESEVNIEMFNPPREDGLNDKPIIRSEKIISEKYRNEGSRSFGTVGTQHTIPSFIKDPDVLKVKDKDKDYVKEDLTKNYEVSKSVERIKRASGLIKKLSVAVVINKDLTPAERSTLRQTVQIASGLNLERGDQVIVTGIRFSSTPYSDLKEQEAQKEFEASNKEGQIKKVLSLVLLGAVGVAVLMVLLFSLSAGIDGKKAKVIDEILKDEDIPLLNTIDERIQEAEEAYHRTLSLETNKNLESMKEGLSQMALQDPKAIARGLQAYMND